MIKNITNTEDISWLSQEGVTVLDFWAPWCGPCKQLSPVLDELADLNIATVVKCNVDEFPNIAASYGVMGVPTLFFFQNGEQAKKMSGVQSLDKLKAAVEQLK